MVDLDPFLIISDPAKSLLSFPSDGCATTTKTARAARTNTTAVSERFADSGVKIGKGFSVLIGS